MSEAVLMSGQPRTFIKPVQATEALWRGHSSLISKTSAQHEECVDTSDKLGLIGEGQNARDHS